MESKLRDDFPIDWEADNFVSRREFLKFTTLASGGLALGSVALAVWSEVPRGEIKFEAAAICKTSEIGEGTSLAFSYPRSSDLCLLIRKPDGELVAYSRRCTHLSCPVTYEQEKRRLYCPCHNGAFSVDDGRVLQGPPPHSLPRVTLEVRGDTIFATGVTRGDEA